MTEFQPSWWLRGQLERTCKFICEDDAMLIEESHHANGCSSLTDLEVTEACLMRGLPITRRASSESRRLSLTNHLKMIDTVRRDPETKVDSDGFRLFTLHLAPIQLYLKSLGIQNRLS